VDSIYVRIIIYKSHTDTITLYTVQAVNIFIPIYRTNLEFIQPLYTEQPVNLFNPIYSTSVQVYEV